MALKDEYVSITEAARLLDVTRQTVSRWVSEGKLQTQRIGRDAIISKKELLKFEENRVVDSYLKELSKLIHTAYADYCWEKGYMTMEERVKEVYTVGEHGEYTEIAVKGKDSSIRIIKLKPKEVKKVQSMIISRLKNLRDRIYYAGYDVGRRLGIMEEEISRKIESEKTIK